MKAPLFQACVGPSTIKCHIRQVGVDHYNPLCETTAVARDVRRPVPSDVICKSCLKKLADLYMQAAKEGLVHLDCSTREGLALAIGVEKIT